MVAAYLICGKAKQRLCSYFISIHVFLSAVKSFDAKQLFQINTFSFTKLLNVDYLWYYTVLNYDTNSHVHNSKYVPKRQQTSSWT